MSLTWCAMRKTNLLALFVVIPVFISQIVSRFCKFQDLFSHTEADSVICDVPKNIAVSYILQEFVTYSEFTSRALHKMTVSSTSMRFTGRICNFKDFVFYYNNRFCNFCSCFKYFCNLHCCVRSQSALESLCIQPIINLKCVKFRIHFLLQKYLSCYEFDMVCYAKSECISSFYVISVFIT